MIFKTVNDLKIGNVVEVSGTSLKVELLDNLTELNISYNGRVYPVGQIGSFVKIHYGRKIIFGLVTQLRMRSEELLESGQKITPDHDQRVMEVQLIAEGLWKSSNQSLAFVRGIKTYPLPQQGVYLLTKNELKKLYQAAETGINKDMTPLIPFGTYSGSDSATCRANINKMFGMHCAVLGSTGSGKSGAVAAIIHSVLEKHCGENKLSPQIILVDPHNEYGTAFQEKGKLFRAYDSISDEDLTGEIIKLPYWLMSSDEFRSLVIGKTEYEATSQNNVILKALAYARMSALGIVKDSPSDYNYEPPQDGLELDEPRPAQGFTQEEIITFDIDKPIPFSLIEFENHIRFVQGARIRNGSIEKETATNFNKKFSSILDKLSVLKRDPRIGFLMEEWDGTDGNHALANIINQFVGVPDKGKDLKIIDISGLPNEIAGPLTAVISRLLFRYKVYQTQKERERDPILLVCEEAHRYVPDRGEAQYSSAQNAVKRIAREGRKYGIGLMLVSQRPSDIEKTVISQCGTWLVLRLTNSADQQHVARFLPDGLSGMTSALSVLSQQEAIFVGEGAALPARITIRNLPKNKLPKSQTIPFAEGWLANRLTLAELQSISSRMGHNVKSTEE